MVEWYRLIVDDSQIWVDGFWEFCVFGQNACRCWLWQNLFCSSKREIWVDIFPKLGMRYKIETKPYGFVSIKNLGG